MYMALESVTDSIVLKLEAARNVIRLGKALEGLIQLQDHGTIIGMTAAQFEITLTDLLTEVERASQLRAKLKPTAK